VGTRCAPCPWEASPSKSRPRYFLIVFALAGDSTMTRLSAMAYGKRLKPKTKNRGPAADLTVSGAAARSMRSIGAQFRHQAAEPLDRQLSPGLTREHHEHDPLQLLGVGLVGFQRQHAFDHDLALLRRDDTRALQRQQQPAALRRQAQQLAVGKNPHAAR